MLPMKGEACSWMWPHCSRVLSAMQRSGFQDSSQARYAPGTPVGIRLHVARFSCLCWAQGSRATRRKCWEPESGQLGLHRMQSGCLLMLQGAGTSDWGWPNGEDGTTLVMHAARAGCGRLLARIEMCRKLGLLLNFCLWVQLCPWQHCSSSVSSLSAPGQACVLPVQRRPASAAVTQLSRASSGGVSSLSHANSAEARVALGRQLSTPA